MKMRRRFLAPLVTVALGLAATAGALTTCTPTNHPSAPADLGIARTAADLERVVDEAGPVTVETVIGADWEVDRSGLINLDHPAAKAAHIVDGPEPIVVEAPRDPAGITFVSADSYPSDDAVFSGTFPLTYRAGEWYI